MSTIRKTMEHLNGCLFVAIDTETTGLEEGFHEICQIALLPLNAQLLPLDDILPLKMTIRPDYPERCEPDALKVNRLKLPDLMIHGIDSEKAKDVLTDWIDRLPLGHTNYGNRKRIIPIGHNYQFDARFMRAWLGDDMYDDLFDVRYRDTLIAAQYLNDYAASRCESVPFPKTTLGYMCSLLKIPYDTHVAHDSLVDCDLTVKIYRAILQRGWLL